MLRAFSGSTGTRQRRSFMTKETKSAELNRVFGNVAEADSYVSESYNKLTKHGFTKENTLPSAILCRDELTAPLLESIDKQWQPSSMNGKSNVFVLSSLAGMFFAGTTGLGAYFSHAPSDSDGVRRFVVYAFPHVGFNSQGEVGGVNRIGIEGETSGCGALVSIKSGMDKNNNVIDDTMDYSDPEISLIKRRLNQSMNASEPPKTLAELTKLTHSMVVEDVEKGIESVLSNFQHRFDYAVYTGVQIHGPGPTPENYVWPGISYAVIDGKKISLVD